MDVRVRFAPSPTGYLHVGGLRTALYNYLFARKHKGAFLLRIEDTDRTRFVEGAMENILKALDWAGIEVDESPTVGGEYGPYKQSERFDLYAEHAQTLIDNGTAYYAFDTSEELDAMRERQQAAGIAPKYDRTIMRNQFTLGEEETQRLLSEGAPKVIRLKVPVAQDVRFTDLVRGDIIVNSREVDDQILLKSDGFPTYHLANIVDDHLMNISHVIRGEEWLPSTPKHVLLYQAFGWEPPVFAHLPLLLNAERKKLSKRHASVAVGDYIEKGYFPEAFVNFVSLLGWNPSGDRELYSMQELIDGFNLERVNKSGAVFETQKLDWMNGEYLRSKDPKDVASGIADKAAEMGYDVDIDYLADVVVLLRERVTFPADILTLGDYMFTPTTQWDPEYIKKAWKEDTRSNLMPLIERFRALEEFTADNLQAEVKAYSKESGVKMGMLMNPIRLAVTGKSVGASMMDTMALLGKERTMQYVDAFLAYIDAQ